MVAHARDFFHQQSVQAEFPEAGVRHIDLHGRIQIARPDCTDMIQGLVELCGGGLASRRERKVVVIIMGFFELGAVNQQGAVPDGLGPEVARLFGEHGLFPISALTGGKNETIHRKPAPDKSLPNVVFCPGITDSGKELAEVNVNLVAEAAEGESGFVVGLPGSDKTGNPQGRKCRRNGAIVGVGGAGEELLAENVVFRLADFFLCPPTIERAGRSAGRLKTLRQVQNHAPAANVHDAASAVRQFFEHGEVAFRLLDHRHQCPRAKILALRDADRLVSRRIGHGHVLPFDVEALNLNTRRCAEICGRRVASLRR